MLIFFSNFSPLVTAVRPFLTVVIFRLFFGGGGVDIPETKNEVFLRVGIWPNISSQNKSRQHFLGIPAAQ